MRLLAVKRGFFAGEPRKKKDRAVKRGLFVIQLVLARDVGFGFAELADSLHIGVHAFGLGGAEKARPQADGVDDDDDDHDYEDDAEGRHEVAIEGIEFEVVADVEVAGGNGGHGQEGQGYEGDEGVGFVFRQLEDDGGAESQGDTAEQLVGDAEHRPDGANVAGVEEIAPAEAHDGAGEEDAGPPAGFLERRIDVGAENVLKDVAAYAGTGVDGGLFMPPMLEKMWAMPTASETAPPGRCMTWMPTSFSSSFISTVGNMAWILA